MEHARVTTGLTKVVCIGPQFRYERPQAGRQRQFSQVDIEAMGSGEPAIDADVVLVGHEVFRRLAKSEHLRVREAAIEMLGSHAEVGEAAATILADALASKHAGPVPRPAEIPHAQPEPPRAPPTTQTAVWASIRSFVR